MEALLKQVLGQAEEGSAGVGLYRCEGFVHGSISAGNYAIKELGKKTGAFSADIADEYSVFKKENLAKYDAILFNNTTHLVFQNDTQRDAVIDFMKQGGMSLRIHAASDNFYKWKPGA